MSCRNMSFCGMGDDCPFDDQCAGSPTSPGYIDGKLATKTPKEPLHDWENEGGNINEQTA